MSDNNNRILKIYLPKGSVNDATVFYISLIEQAFKEIGYLVSRIDTLDDLSKNDEILTVESLPFLKAKLKWPKAKVYNWFQGAFPEEAYLTRKKYSYKFIFSVLEYFTLKFSSFHFMVSEAMLTHYKEKYRIKDLSNTVVMPCYNKPLKKDSFFIQNKYERPAFVYAGSGSEWQCIRETIALYKKIENKVPDSSLTLLTKDKEICLQYLKEFEVENFEIKYVSLNDLDNELSNYKYGFLIRKDDVINRVSTPTKMNSYLAAGIIPIYTDVISDFNLNISLNKFDIILDHNDVIDNWASKIIDFELQETVDSTSYFETVNKLFDTYYNDKLYIQKIVTALKAFN